jgi:hypothetical protein
MLIAYHSERKPWGIKAVSLFVIFTFVATQSDVQLGFANVMTPSAAVVSPASDLNKSDKIHYMQDVGQQQDLQGQADQNPLSGVDPNKVQQNPFAGDVPQQGQTPQISTSFLTGQNPLVGKTDVGVTSSEDPETHVVTASYTDGTYFKYQKSDNKLLEICDKTRLTTDANGNPVKDAGGNDVYA